MNGTAREIVRSAWIGTRVIAFVGGLILFLAIVGRPLFLPIYAAIMQLLSLSFRELLAIPAIAVAFLTVATVVGFGIRQLVPENKEETDDR